VAVLVIKGPFKLQSLFIIWIVLNDVEYESSYNQISFISFGYNIDS
jgi:hypothetical protein